MLNIISSSYLVIGVSINSKAHLLKMHPAGPKPLATLDAFFTAVYFGPPLVFCLTSKGSPLAAHILLRCG